MKVPSGQVRSPDTRAGMCGGVMLLLCGLLSQLLCGCATTKEYSLTYKLWTTPDFRQFCESASPANLQLFQELKHNDVLVAYDESREGESNVQRRAYFLFSNLQNVEAHRKPGFVSAPLAAEMMPIPLVTEPSPLQPVCAIVSANGREFTLYMTGRDPCHHALPVYPVESGFVPRLFLTPLAVAGDVVMVGIVGSVVFVYCAAQEGLSIEVP